MPAHAVPWSRADPRADQRNAQDDRPLPVLHLQPHRQAVRQEPRPAQPDRRSSAGPRARPSSTAPSSPAAAAASARRSPSRWTTSASATSASPPRARSTRRLVFDATGITHSTDLVALQQFFTPLMRSLTDNARVAGARHRPRAGRGQRRAHRPARARGLHPLAGQGDRQGQHRQPGVRRPGRRGRPWSPRSPSSSPPRAPTSPARSPASAPPAPRRPRRSPTRPSR